LVILACYNYCENDSIQAVSFCGAAGRLATFLKLCIKGSGYKYYGAARYIDTFCGAARDWLQFFLMI